MFIRLYDSSICAFDTLKCTCLSVRCYIEPEACVCVCTCVSVRVCVRVCVRVSHVFLLFVTEGHNENKICMCAI